jgi:triosephosphate isomerase (TIM)
MAMGGRTFILNFKNYQEVLGEGSLRLTAAAQKASERTGLEVVVAPPAPLLAWVASRTSIPVYGQRAEAKPEGKSTGALIPEALKGAGCKGAIINHSEARISIAEVGELVPRLRSLGLASCVCAESVEEIERMAAFSPDYLAIEPPELIGSGVAVSKAKPELITRSVSAARGTGSKSKILCGAGIVDGSDVRAATKLGTEGILVASSVVKAKDWDAKVSELASALLD